MLRRHCSCFSEFNDVRDATANARLFAGYKYEKFTVGKILFDLILLCCRVYKQNRIKSVNWDLSY